MNWSRWRFAVSFVTLWAVVAVARSAAAEPTVISDGSDFAFTIDEPGVVVCHRYPAELRDLRRCGALTENIESQVASFRSSGMDIVTMATLRLASGRVEMLVFSLGSGGSKITDPREAARGMRAGMRSVAPDAFGAPGDRDDQFELLTVGDAQVLSLDVRMNYPGADGAPHPYPSREYFVPGERGSHEVIMLAATAEPSAAFATTDRIIRTLRAPAAPLSSFDLGRRTAWVAIYGSGPVAVVVLAGVALWKRRRTRIEALRVATKRAARERRRAAKRQAASQEIANGGLS